MTATAVICLGVWSVLAFVACLAMHRGRRQRALLIGPPYPHNVPVPPPVTPPFSQTEPSADWFWGVPSDCLGDDAIRVLADDIERRWFA